MGYSMGQDLFPWGGMDVSVLFCEEECSCMGMTPTYSFPHRENKQAQTVF